MTVGFHPSYTLMVRKLESIFSLSAEEKQALHDLPVQVMKLRADQDIVRLGDRPFQCCLILEGYTSVYKLTSDGKRQLMALHVAGDIPDLQSLHLPIMDHNIATLTPCTVGFVQHRDVLQVCERYPRLTAAFWRNTLIDASIFREWLLNVGRREAYARIAHLLCEILTRLKAVELVEDGNFDLPVTQTELADATGISSVHMNRVFKALRADGLIQTKGKRIFIPNWEKMKEAGDFDPHYLHLKGDDAA